MEYNKRPATDLAGGEGGAGRSRKLAVEDGVLTAAEDVLPEDVLVALRPYAAVVNTSGGRADGKICPHSLRKMFRAVPCSFGSGKLFGDVAAREEAVRGYHR